ncbi:MAG: hypothetical protein ABR575_07140 [Actinomycetota bacterium]
MRRSRVGSILVARACALLLVAACADDPTLRPESAASGSPTDGSAPVATPETPACKNETDVLARGDARVDEGLRGDVDGDGTDDEVSIYMDPTGPMGCQAFLVVDAAAGRGAVEVWTQGREAGLPQPRLHGMAPVNDLSGSEVLVDEAAGASTQFLAVFAWVDGDLSRIEPPEEAAPDLWAGRVDGLFAYGGSVGHLEAADCVARARIVVSVALPQGNGYEVTRGTYTVAGARLQDERVQRERIGMNELDELARRFPEYGGAPFSSCTT